MHTDDQTHTQAGEDVNELKLRRLKHPSKLQIGHLNINSVRYKCDQLFELIDKNLDVLFLTETKLGSSFTTAQFYIDGYHSPFRKDRNESGGGVMCYVNENIVCERLDVNFPDEIESVFLELNLKSEKFLFVGLYRPPDQPVQYTLQHISDAILKLNYEQILLTGDLNLDPNDDKLDTLREELGLTNLITEPTCFKSPTNPSCVDHIWVSHKSRYVSSRTFETGLSDFHKLVLTSLKASVPKHSPRVMMYRNFKKLNEHAFRADLKQAVDSSKGSGDFQKFESSLKELVDKHLPIKKKFIRNNSSPFMTKRLRKEIMIRSRKRNIFNANPSSETWNCYRIQRNKCTRLIRDAKRNYYNSLNMNVITDTKKFWRTVKPIFSEKAVPQKLTSIIEGGKVIDEKADIAAKMNTYFVNITDSLDINSIPVSESDLTTTDKIDVIVDKFRNHPSIVKIKSLSRDIETLSFVPADADKIGQYIGKLKENVSLPEGDIPVKIIKKFANEFIDEFTDIQKKVIQESTFPDSLKFADVAPLHKKGSKFLKENYRSVSKLSAFSKVYERVIFDQLYDFVGPKLSPLLSGFRKGYSTQHALLHMLHSWHRDLDKGQFVAAVLMDLSKAFDCMNHDLLLAKLHAYGLSKPALQLIESYLSGRKQRVGIEHIFSPWLDMKIGVPQGSILGPLLFNIFINDLLLDFHDTNVGVCNYADDNTIYASGKSVLEVKQKLEKSLAFMSDWFKKNGFQLNADKCQFIVFGSRRDEFDNLCFNGEILDACQDVKLLGVTFDSSLTFEKHISKLCRSANAKVSALQRVACFMSAEKLRLIANAFVNSETSYCPLVWSFCSRGSMNKIERLNKRVRHLVGFSADSESKSVHRLFCERLLTEVFKTRLHLNPAYMQSVFTFKENQRFDLRSGDTLMRNRIQTTKFGLQSVSHIGAQLWDSLPSQVKSANSSKEFSGLLKALPVLKCKCRLCADYIQNLGFL